MSPEDNVVQLFDNQTAHDVSHSLQAKELHKVFKSEKFMFVSYEEDGNVRFHSGAKLNIGDITYLQKVMNIKADGIIEASMFS